MKLIPQYAESLKDPKRMDKAYMANSRNSIYIIFNTGRTLTFKEIKSTLDAITDRNEKIKKEYHEYTLSYAEMIYKHLSMADRELLDKLINNSLKEEVEKYPREYDRGKGFIKFKR